MSHRDLFDEEVMLEMVRLRLENSRLDGQNAKLYRVLTTLADYIAATIRRNANSYRGGRVALDIQREFLRLVEEAELCN